MLRRRSLALAAVLAAAAAAPAQAAPVAALSAPARVKAGSPVTFDASSSEGTIAAYEWDLDGSGAFATTTQGPKLTVTFDVAGSRTVSVRVRNAGGESSVASVEIAVDAAAPAGAPADPEPEPRPGEPPIPPAPLGGDAGAGVAPLSVPAQSLLDVGSRTRFAALGGAARRRLDSVRRRGLWVNLLSDRPARFRLVVLVRRHGKLTRVRRATFVLPVAGQKAARIRPSRRLRRALRGRSRRVVVRGTAMDLGANRTRVRRAFALRR